MNSIPTFSVPFSHNDKHDGVVVSSNLYAILKDNGIIGNPDKMVEVFGRDNFSLLVVDSDTMVRDDDSKIIGTQNLLCMDVIGKSKKLGRGGDEMC